MNTNQREPEGDRAPLLTFNIEVHHHGKSARYCRASRAAQHAFCCTSSPQHLTSLSSRPRPPLAYGGTLNRNVLQ